MRKIPISVMLLLLCLFFLTSCKDQEFYNPGDYLGGGGKVDEVDNVDDSSVDLIKDSVTSNINFKDLSNNTSSVDAIYIDETNEIIEITKSGTYYFSGTYKGIKICDNKLALHFIFDGVTLENNIGSAIDGTEYKKTTLIITLKNGTTNLIKTQKENTNAIHVKGSLAFNGTGSLEITSEGKSTIKATKELMLVDCTLNLIAANHALTALSIACSNCTINVISAGKDGINAECDDETTEFTTDEGYVYLYNVNYTCNVLGDGIQADTVVYIDGGTYQIKTTGNFVENTAENRLQYNMTTDDFRYIKNGNTYQKVASDYRGRNTMYGLAQGCKGIKVGEIEYPDPTNEANEIIVTDGDYNIIIESGTFDIDSTDDAIHANSGNIAINGGIFNISTFDDGITADKLTKIANGNINIDNCYEGIEGGYVEITGGTINIVSTDDGINAASDDKSIVEHIIISGGNIKVNSSGDGIDSNGSILISGGEVYVSGSDSGADAALDADAGILITGGYLFAVGALGMVETPASNSTQNVISFAINKTIQKDTNIALTDATGNIIISFNTPKNCQSIIISCPELEKGQSYNIFGGDNNLCSFKVETTITTVGSSNNIGGHGTMPPGGFGDRGPGRWRKLN